MDWKALSARALDGETITETEALAILQSSDDELLDVLQGAYRIRKKYFGKKVSLHLLRNVKSGKCPEDCSFCSQSTSAINDVERYDFQTVESIVDGAQAAVDRQAKRYCVVSSTRAPSPNELETICEAAIQIKQKHPDLEICSSLGLLTEEKAVRLKDAGVNRFNHNLETSENYFPEVVISRNASTPPRLSRKSDSTSVAAGSSAWANPCRTASTSPLHWPLSMWTPCRSTSSIPGQAHRSKANPTR